MANNKIVLEGGEVLIDLTADTVTQSDVASGVTFHDKSGALKTGTSTKDVDSSGATASVSEILETKTAGVRGTIVTGTMKNNGKVTGTISTKAGKYTIPVGYHDGSGTVQISSTEQAKLIPTNIREGVTILGVLGEMSGSEGEIPETNKDVTPTFEEQVIVPSEGFTCLKQVTVSAISVRRTENSAGGTTVTIG